MPDNHQHTHHDHHGEHHDYTAANKDFFNADQYAHTYDDKPEHIELSNNVSAAMRKSYVFDENNTTVMDFACGTGLSSRAIAPYAKSVLGVDISQGMLNKFTEQAASKGLAHKMNSICIELKGADGELDGAKFDVITCSMAWHHFDSLKDMTRILVSFLKPGGALFVADLEPPSKDSADSATAPKGIDEKYAHIVPHKHGFEVEDMKTFFEGAGLVDFDMNHVCHARAMGQYEVDVFLARGIKPKQA